MCEGKFVKKICGRNVKRKFGKIGEKKCKSVK
jgi:hypothetical protein